MTLREVIDEMEVERVTGNLDATIAGLAYDSRRVKPGDLFFALAGAKQDGARFVHDALAAGAAAVVSAPGAAAEAATRVEVAEPRRALAQAAGRFHDHPSRAMKVVAVTGTNGKTTTTWMLESIFRAAGWSAGLIGTTGVRFAEQERAIAFTTPEAPELQALLAEMRDAGVGAVAMEVSSHALAQRRAYGIDFDVAIFTNLTQDHLDYHGSMDAYLDAKLMLFDGRNGATRKRTVAVVNSSDPNARRVIEAGGRGGLHVLSVGLDLEERRPPIDLDMHVEGIRATPKGLRLQCWIGTNGELKKWNGVRPWVGGETTFEIPMLGRYNAANAIGALAAALALGISERDAIRGLEQMPGVPGRLERVDAGQSFTVVVDYAHTPDALERALAAAREHAHGRVLLVFGCGGDRDRGKRPTMGAIAARLADAAWVTNDNPRSEDPAAIAREIVAGAAGGGRSLAVVLDRRAAIAEALAAAREGDVVLIAGKGHETTQTVGDRVTPFDDREVARGLLSGGRAS